MDNQTQKTVERLTKQYVAKMQRIAKLEEELTALKSTIVALAPQGAKTPHGTWQTYADGTRQSYSVGDVAKLVDALIMEGNTDVAQRILTIRKESNIQGGMKFIKPKQE